MIFISTQIAVDIKEENYLKLQEERIKQAKDKLHKVIWHKYHKNIEWDKSEWLRSRSDPHVLVYDMSARIDV